MQGNSSKGGIEMGSSNLARFLLLLLLSGVCVCVLECALPRVCS